MVSAEDRVGPVTAVVVNYQGEGYLAACLDALAALDLDEVLVVDNASTDGGLALVERDYPHVQVVRLETNGGPSVARNVGMQRARNRWVLGIDNDVVVEPDVLTQLRAAANDRPDAVIVQPRSVFRADPERVHYDGGYLHFAGLIALRNSHVRLAEAEGQGTVEVDVAVSLCLLVDSQALAEVGSYDERYFFLFEDLDLSYRVRAAGHAILSVENAIVHHDAGTPGLSYREGQAYPVSRVFYHSRNRWLYMIEDLHWWTLLVSLPALVAYELAWLGFAVTRGQIWAWIRGKTQVLGNLGPSLRKRRRVQRARRVGDRALLVAGPLTIVPALRTGRWAGLVLGLLDRGLSTWWRLARRLVP